MDAKRGTQNMQTRILKSPALLLGKQRNYNTIMTFLSPLADLTSGLCCALTNEITEMSALYQLKSCRSNSLPALFVWPSGVNETHLNLMAEHFFSFPFVKNISTLTGRNIFFFIVMMMTICKKKHKMWLRDLLSLLSRGLCRKGFH